MGRSWKWWGLLFIRLVVYISFVTSWTGARQAPLSMGFPRQEYWRGLLFLPPGDLPDPGMEPVSPAWQADSLPLSHLVRTLLLTFYWLKRWGCSQLHGRLGSVIQLDPGKRGTAFGDQLAVCHTSEEMLSALVTREKQLKLHHCTALLEQDIRTRGGAFHTEYALLHLFIPCTYYLQHTISLLYNVRYLQFVFYLLTPTGQRYLSIMLTAVFLVSTHCLNGGASGDILPVTPAQSPDTWHVRAGAPQLFGHVRPVALPS